MGKLSEAYVEIRGDDSRLPGDLDKSRGLIVDKLSAAGQQAGAAIAKALAAAMVASLTTAVVVMKRSVDSAIESEEAISKLNAVLKATGESAGFTSQEMQQLASDLQSVTTHGDEAILGVETLLATFRNVRGQVFKDATEAALDLNATLGTGLPQAAIMLGKALNDPIRGITALGRAGVTLTEDQKLLVKSLQETGDMAGAQRVILTELANQMGGSARAAAQTLAGSWKQLGNTIDDIQESIGQHLLPYLGAMADVLREGLVPELRATVDELGLLGEQSNAVDNLTLAFARLFDILSSVRLVFRELQDLTLRLVSLQIRMLADWEATMAKGLGMGTTPWLQGTADVFRKAIASRETETAKAWEEREKAPSMEERMTDVIRKRREEQRAAREAAAANASAGRTNENVGGGGGGGTGGVDGAGAGGLSPKVTDSLSSMAAFFRENTGSSGSVMNALGGAMQGIGGLLGGASNAAAAAGAGGGVGGAIGKAAAAAAGGMGGGGDPFASERRNIYMGPIELMRRIQASIPNEQDKNAKGGGNKPAKVDGWGKLMELLGRMLGGMQQVGGLL